MADNVCPVRDDGQEDAIRVSPCGRTVRKVPGEGVIHMWFYIPAIVLIVLFFLWFRRTNLYRHRNSGDGTHPDQQGAEGRGWNVGGEQGGGGGDLGG
jgi:hypothetical protein